MKKLNLLEELKKEFESSDYQNRGGNYPQSNKPVSIDVNYNEASKKIVLNASFKNTTQYFAENWMSDRLLYIERDYKIKFEVSSEQTGDYTDDWVDAYAVCDF